MAEEKKVSDVMTKSVVSVRLDSGVDDAIELFKKYSYKSFPVVNEKNEVKGVINENAALLHALFQSLPKTFSKMMASVGVKNLQRLMCTAAGELMDAAAVISQNAELEEAVRVMAKERVDRLIVVDESNKLIGIISKRDIIKGL